MSSVDYVLASRSDIIEEQIGQLVTHLGESNMLSVPYDTSWLARLSLKYPEQGFDQAYDWLIHNQHQDGSWGSDALHFHDRVISTLSAVIALQIEHKPGNDKRIALALAYIRDIIDCLSSDANDTINFRGIASLLLTEAGELGLEVPKTIYYKNDHSGGKLAKFRDRPNLWRDHPITYSLECFRPTLPEASALVTSNGSLSVSPAASIALLLNSPASDNRVLNFLTHIIRPDGGIPTVAPIDLFEITWSLNVLRQAGALEANQPRVKRLLDQVWSNWSPERGNSYSSYFSTPDLDDTATTFTVLRWGGYPVEPSVFAYYEEQHHFRCYPDETDPSLSAQIRLLAALKDEIDYPNSRAWINKILAFLNRRAQNRELWTDKWHASPLYLVSISVSTLHHIHTELAIWHLNWIMRTQREDGGWGCYGFSTPEETAYALHALLYWHRNVQKLDLLPMKSAVDYLTAHLQDDYIPLWIGKCLYTPVYVVQAAILSALYAYQTLTE